MECFGSAQNLRLLRSQARNLLYIKFRFCGNRWSPIRPPAFSLATRLPFLRVAMSRKLNRLAAVFGSPAGGEDNGPSARGDG